MEKDEKIEINVALLMEHADKIIHDPGLGKAPVISQLVEEIQINGQIYELRLELKLKAQEEASDQLIV